MKTPLHCTLEDMVAWELRYPGQIAVRTLASKQGAEDAMPWV